MSNFKVGRPRVQVPDQFLEIYTKWVKGEIQTQDAFYLLGLTKSTFYRVTKIFAQRLEKQGLTVEVTEYKRLMEEASSAFNGVECL